MISKPTALYAGVRLDFEIQIFFSVTEVQFSLSILLGIKKIFNFLLSICCCQHASKTNSQTQQFTFVHPQFKSGSQAGAQRPIELFSTDLSRHMTYLKLIFILFRPYNPIELKLGCVVLLMQAYLEYHVDNFDVTSERHKTNLQRHECNVTAYVTIFNASSLHKPASTFRILPFLHSSVVTFGTKSVHSPVVPPQPGIKEGSII